MNKENLNLLSREKLEELVELQEQIISVNSERIEIYESHIRVLKNVKIKPFGLAYYFFLFAIALSTILVSNHFGYEHKLSQIAYKIAIIFFMGYTITGILFVILHNRMVKKIISNERKTPTFEVKFNIGGNIPEPVNYHLP